MTRLFLTTILMLLLSLPLAAQGSLRRGPGCWRGAKPQQETSRRAGQHRAGTTVFQGKKKGLVILAEFPDMNFRQGHGRAKYNDILNAPGYTTSEGFRGSVADYFREQSGGLFELEFDVVGPYMTKHKYAYYGENNEQDDDKRPEEMVIEMCQAADDEVNFADYDWDGDRFVDEVFVVYAGRGEADGGNEKTIWPHMWALSSAGRHLALDNRYIDVYACANEMQTDFDINGIGTFCHEFSHCLGLPDFYDRLNYEEFGMAEFDLMDSGAYIGNGFTPVGYTAYEKMFCGWQEPIELGREDVTVDSLKPMSENGDSYIIFNDGNHNEYYMIEYRRKTGWDVNYPTEGLMITHVDYNKTLWDYNTPNCIYTDAEARLQNLPVSNDHQRMTIFHADYNDQYWSTKTDLYPFAKNDSLTATSNPAATLYHKNSLGLKTMTGSILDIRKNNNGTMAFRYRAVTPTITAIRETESPNQITNIIYTIDGRVAGTPSKSLPHGVYIVGGKKVVR